MYKVIVIGRGLIGAAAGRHLAALVEGVAVVGPDEPESRVQHDGVFASHYDEGRMTRMVDPDPAWAVTATRSIARYGELEAQSAIRFFTPSGYLGIEGPDSDYLERSATTGRAHGATLSSLDASSIRARYPFLSVDDDIRGLVEEGGTAGHVSPRAMVAAQTEAARRSGADIVAEEVTALRAISGGVEITTRTQRILRAERVLITVGGYANACGLLPTSLDLEVFGRTVALARLDDELCDALALMPTMVHAESGAYILPPIVYPDGHTYVKIGIGTDQDRRLRTYEELAGWFKSDGSERNLQHFRRFLVALIPPLARCAHWQAASCVVTQTPSGLPYIDKIDNGRIAVAIGGNGKGAKSSDDWGWLAARLMTDAQWDHPVARDRLRVPH